MPPQLQALMQNRNALIGIGAGLLLIIVLTIVMAVNGGGEKKKEDPGAKPLLETQRTLATDIAAGKAIEIQAVLARQGIRLETEPGTGGKVSLMFGKEATLHERDEAILALVSMGLMDGHLGMEAFDSSDMMASREEKQVKLMRAQEGELARIIRKIKPVEDVSVRVSMPDATLFSAEKQPPTASIQVVLPPEERLTRDKVRSIINLAVGAVQGLEAKYVALTDTNGNTYNSVINSSAELQDKMEEQDTYMRQKVMTQLDKLLGVGNYVVTVATELREAPREMMVQQFDPARSAVASKQRFSENLGAKGQGGMSGLGGSGGPTSSFLPPELDSKVAYEKTNPSGMVAEGGGSSSDNYSREGIEVSYENARTQWVESSVPGMLEDISIAVTVDDSHFPNMPAADLQTLIARAASPKVNPNRVSIARTDFQHMAPTPPDTPLPEPPLEGTSFVFPGLSPEQSMGLATWLPWAGISIAVVIGLLVIAGIQSKANEANSLAEASRQQVEELKQVAQQQHEQLHYQEQINQQLNVQQQQLAQQLHHVQQGDVSHQRLRATLEKMKASQVSAPPVPTAPPPNLSSWLQD